MNNYKREFNQLNFIKLYEGKAVNVNCEIKDMNYQVVIWFEIKQNAKMREGGRGS